LEVCAPDAVDGGDGSGNTFELGCRHAGNSYVRSLPEKMLGELGSPDSAVVYRAAVGIVYSHRLAHDGA
jgi:hypothetical protein